MIRNTVIDMPAVKTKADIEMLLMKVHQLRACQGTSDDNITKKEWSSACHGYLPSHASVKVTRCDKCLNTRRALKREQYKKSLQEKFQAVKQKVRFHRQRTVRLQEKVIEMNSFPTVKCTEYIYFRPHSLAGKEVRVRGKRSYDKPQ